MENIEERLAQVWQKYAGIDEDVLRSRKYIYCNNLMQKDILVTGINPSFNPRDKDVTTYEFQDIVDNDKPAYYWTLIKEMLRSESDKIDYTQQTAYLDLFYFKETRQDYLRKSILKNPLGVQFLVDQLRITQQVIEEIIKPKVIVIKNKESYAYWGKLSDKGYIWMGYEFEHLERYDCGEVCRIKGFVNSKERILPELAQSNLVGSIVLFSKYEKYLRLEKRVNAKTIEQLLSQYR